MKTTGLEGVVNIVESPIGVTRFHLVNGLVFERGFVSEELKYHHNCNIIIIRQELEHPLVLVVSNKIKEVRQIVPSMDIAKRVNRPLLVFSEDLQ
jgi:chaperonin GroEL